MAHLKQDIPNRVTVYLDDAEQELALKEAMLPEKPRYFNGSPTYQASNVEEFKAKLDGIGLSLEK
ncbi:hypothetical protein [Vibrio sonorensis]|uniref:hypothetical protein n=1 Tax=Vibrio sonorensis TaxID=1004316 RepID=UPI0008DAAA1B|nr:hypothetical protein [Vibrio sonorensis]